MSTDDIAQAARMTVYGLFRAQALAHPKHHAVEWQARIWTYDELLVATDRLAERFERMGLVLGDRVAVLAENRIEYLLLQLAAARLGVIVACLNWRLASEEIGRCIDLATPKVLFVSPRHFAAGTELASGRCAIVPIGDCLHPLVAIQSARQSPVQDNELPLLLLYTSGTTGTPKGALISQRAEIARMTVLRLDLGLEKNDAYIAWSPMFHMGGTEHTLASLMFGAKVIITDGLDLDVIMEVLSTTTIGWLLLVPATIEPLVERLLEVKTSIAGVKIVGCMADLVSPALIARLTGLLGARFLNSFGSTETGLAPLSGHLIPRGEAPTDLSKQLSSLCEFRVVGVDDSDVADGETGEGIVRGPTVFSGYWDAPEANEEVFRGGWFHMGDLFRHSDGGGYEFVGRSKYLIKSGGENIYPAEIERVLLSDPRILDAAVVRKPDLTWGEIAVAFIATSSSDLTPLDVELLCRRFLAGYKRPREVHFISLDELPRSLTGKVMREALEQRLRIPSV